jgi:hypothetical protein
MVFIPSALSKQFFERTNSGFYSAKSDFTPFLTYSATGWRVIIAV